MHEIGLNEMQLLPLSCWIRTVDLEAVFQLGWQVWGVAASDGLTALLRSVSHQQFTN